MAKVCRGFVEARTKRICLNFPQDKNGMSLIILGTASTFTGLRLNRLNSATFWRTSVFFFDLTDFGDQETG